MVYDIGPRVARKISLGGIVTASATILFLKFEAVDYMKPHGNGLLIIATYGVLTPLAIIIANNKIRKFIKDRCESKTRCLWFR